MTGMCDCPAGWGEQDCGSPLKRPCTNRLQPHPRNSTPASHIGPDKRDLDWKEPGYTYSRCAGICDDDIGACYCDGEKHGRIPQPPDAPPSVKPIREGRVLIPTCSVLSDDGNGTQLDWQEPRGARPYEHIYGPQGWCMVDEPPLEHRCLCELDGLAGDFCEIRTEMFCPNQCSGHGECHLGFCHCQPDWFGADCAHRRAQPGSVAGTEACVQVAAATEEAARKLAAETRWLKDHVVDHWHRALNHTTCGFAEETGQQQGGTQPTAAAPASPGFLRRLRQLLGGEQRRQPADGERGRQLKGKAVGTGGGGSPGRRRPLIYVYDVPSLYASRLLQYRILKQDCAWRVFSAVNDSMSLFGSAYGIESHLHELFLQSEHRTLDPEEADFFYVPAYMTCMIYPINAWADYPWFYIDTYFRVKQAAILARDLNRWIREHLPYWNRTQGRDHIWLFAHDEGACWAPSAIYNNSIILTHWGRADIFHISGTSYGQDNYSMDVTDDPYIPGGYRQYIDNHPCYTPGKDMVIPLFKPPEHYARSPFLGAAPVKRDILMLFRGLMGTHHPPGYSRGVRQMAYAISKEQNWKDKYNIWIGTREDVPGEYSELLSRSVFCLVAAGDGWSSRFDDAMLHGCIPLIAIDNVHGPWHGLLQYTRFTVRIRQEDVPYIPQILARISPERIQRMQRTIARIWHRYAWLSHPMVQKEAGFWKLQNSEKAGQVPADAITPDSPFQPLQPDDVKHDAFSTLLQWLYHRLHKKHEVSDADEWPVNAEEAGD